MHSPNPKLNRRTFNLSESFVKGHLEFARAWRAGTCQRGLRSRLRNNVRRTNFRVPWRTGKCRSLWICRDSVKPVMTDDDEDVRRMIEMTVEFTFRCLRRQELTNNFESGSWCVSWSSDLPNAASMQPSLFICTHGAILLNCRTYKYHYDV